MIVSVAGPWQFGKVDQGFFALWIWKHINKRKLNYIGFGGYGNQIRDILHIEDLNELIYKQIINIKRIKNKSFSVGGSSANAISLKKLTKICQKITNNKIEINSLLKKHQFMTYLILFHLINMFLILIDGNLKKT